MEAINQGAISTIYANDSLKRRLTTEEFEKKLEMEYFEYDFETDEEEIKYDVFLPSEISSLNMVTELYFTINGKLKARKPRAVALVIPGEMFETGISRQLGYITFDDVYRVLIDEPGAIFFDSANQHFDHYLNKLSTNNYLGYFKKTSLISVADKIPELTHDIPIAEAYLGRNSIRVDLREDRFREIWQNGEGITKLVLEKALDGYYSIYSSDSFDYQLTREELLGRMVMYYEEEYSEEEEDNVGYDVIATAKDFTIIDFVYDNLLDSKANVLSKSLVGVGFEFLDEIIGINKLVFYASLQDLKVNLPQEMFEKLSGFEITGELKLGYEWELNKETWWHLYRTVK